MLRPMSILEHKPIFKYCIRFFILFYSILGKIVYLFFNLQRESSKRFIFFFIWFKVLRMYLGVGKVT